MIAGTLVIEDTAITFVITTGVNEELTMAPQARYTACDTHTGLSERRTVDARAFMIALGIALDFDGGENRSIAEYELAESVQPESKHLRFIP